jgi:hypothetical protein
MPNQDSFDSIKRWHWTDDLARVLADAGHPKTTVPLEWIAVPVAVRGDGEPLAVAEALLGTDDEDPSLAA